MPGCVGVETGLALGVRPALSTVAVLIALALCEVTARPASGVSVRLASVRRLLGTWVQVAPSLDV